ncbi:60S ribosomal protein L43 [Modicella reniformis]|uniref:60S ribosomal protein L43 n=1 Tax=Modicella reniformis TaxID=1440133 RepID=A0A9P6MJV8_9FUNG|nr:60S ribosomal protein L43 [Modicella reniformis]
MFPKQSAIVWCLLFLGTLASVCHAHVSLKYPCIRKSPHAPCPKASEPDYDINAPIGTKDNPTFPICKHPNVRTKRTGVKAGQNLQTTYHIGANHGGGHCQWALSYDEGKSWVVIKTLIRQCLKNSSNGGTYTIPVNIPRTAPNGDAVFMWLWNNAVGNRELYSNCADITISGSNGGPLKGVVPLIANYGASSLKIDEFMTDAKDDKHQQTLDSADTGCDEGGSSHHEFAKRTKKVGVVGKYGVRYGASLRKQVKKMEITQHSKYTCTFCGRDAVKRQAVGIWKCRGCKKTMAGGAWTLSTTAAATVRSTTRRLRELIEV